MSHPAFSAATTAEEVASVFADRIQGKNVLITGTSINGIGFEAARVLAKYANLVVITGYNSERLKLSQDAIKKDFPTANIRPLTLDLRSLTSVREAAAEVSAYHEPLHVLIHNAYAATAEHQLTEDKLESQMAVGQIGPFLLTKLLAPKLLAAATGSYIPRVVYVSSMGHALGAGIDLNTVEKGDPEKYAMMGRHCEVKSANILSAIELSKRSKGKINGYSLHPGAVVTNIVQKEDTKEALQEFGLLGPDGLPSTKIEWKTIPQAAATIVAAAFTPELDAKPGAYLVDCVVASNKSAPHSSDPETAAKLWTV
ncbi:NAD-P-binding protein, partial [Mycena metata]